MCSSQVSVTEVVVCWHCWLQTSRMLDEEQRDDTELKDRFKEKWTREPSSKLTETLRKEVMCYSGIPLFPPPCTLY